MMNEERLAQSVREPSGTLETVVATIETLMQDWDIEEAVGPQTRVVADLGFESIDLIQMVAALETAFRLPRGSLVEMLVSDGRYVDDLSVRQIAERVDARIARGSRS